MRFLTTRPTSSSKKNLASTFSFWLILSLFLFNSRLNAQQLKSSFFLDTLQTQIFPYDLDFSLKLVDSKDARIKYVYLIRINNKGKVVCDKQTSFFTLGQRPNAKHLILGQLKKRISNAQEYINKYSNSIDSLETEKQQKEDLLKEETDDEKKVQLIRDINEIRIKFDKFQMHRKLISKLKSNSQKYIKDVKSKPELTPLKIEGRDKDTLIVEVKALKPNKDYLILAVNESKKTDRLKELINEYLEYGFVEKKEVVVIPIQYLPNKPLNRYKLDKSDPLRVINKSTKKLPIEVKFEIQLKILEEEFEKAKKKNIKSLLKISSEKPILKSLKGSVTFPGPFEYPVNSGIRDFPYDSLVSNIPKDFNQDFRIINAVLSQFNNYGDSIVAGKYKLEEDVDNVLKVDYSPKTDLKSQLNTITNHLNLVTKAQQSLFILAEAEKGNFQDFNEYFSKTIKVLSDNRDTVAKKVDVNSKVNDILSGLSIPYGLESTTLEKSTFLYQFLTRNSGVIKQSFGLVYYFTGKHNFAGAAPYTGVDFQLRPTNEDTKFWKTKGWKKYFSFQLGVPLFASDLTKGDQRKHLVGDAFSLYTGLGINLGHSVKIGYGAILFRSIDGNSIGENSYEINSLHSVSVGVNFKLIPLFRSIFGSDKAINLL